MDILGVPTSWRTRLFWAAVFVAVAVAAYFAGVYWQLHRSEARISELKQAYLAEQDKLYVLSKDRASALKLVAVSQASLDKLQRSNDAKVKEVVRVVYKQKMAIPDADVPDYWAEFVTGVWSRDNQRKSQ